MIACDLRWKINFAVTLLTSGLLIIADTCPEELLVAVIGYWLAGATFVWARSSPNRIDAAIGSEENGIK